MHCSYARSDESAANIIFSTCNNNVIATIIVILYIATGLAAAPQWFSLRRRRKSCPVSVASVHAEVCVYLLSTPTDAFFPNIIMGARTRICLCCEKIGKKRVERPRRGYCYFVYRCGLGRGSPRESSLLYYIVMLLF